MWILRSSENSAKPTTFRMTSGAVRTIGRAKGANIIIDAPLVSRVHCRLDAGKAGIDVTDLPSTNGTFVNDKRIDRPTLVTGDRLRVGRVEFILDRAGGRGSV